MGWGGILVVFFGGWLVGLTTVPVLALVFWVYGTTCKDSTSRSYNTTSLNDSSGDDTERVGLGPCPTDPIPVELKERRDEPDVASGYFAVCREYVPGGTNGKPPERTTPAGAVVAMESPSVYQTMYRSLFNKNKVVGPSIDGIQGKSKRARNVFYIVLRLGHLMLYDDAEQLEVRHVVSLAHYIIDIYAGGEPIPEGELFIKRNCIRLTQRTPADGLANPKPFFLFSENCSEKEDFYHAMLQSRESHASTPQKSPLPLKFDTPDLVRLVQQLHASEENLHTRWINALIGRLFLAMYKTQDIEHFLWAKISKKIARVPKPALIDGIHVRRIDMGDLPPFITNPRLKDLTVDGDLTVEADVSYKGSFRLEISAIARIELGSRFKAREVTLILATILKRLEGHVLLRIKPPPSNRVWVTFEAAPKMDLSIEPIVSSRQITYGVIIRAIESRIREVVGETLVFPNWDDIPFSSTSSHQFRGGLWREGKKKEESKENMIDNTLELDTDGLGKGAFAEDLVTKLDGLETGSAGDGTNETVQSAPTLRGRDSLRLQKANSGLSAADEDIGVSSGTDQWCHAKPRTLRSGSFASAASPIVNACPAISRFNERKHPNGAASSIRTTMSRSPPSSPVVTACSTIVPDSPSHKDGVKVHDHGPEDLFDTMSSDQIPKMSSQSLPSSVGFASTELEHGVYEASCPANDGPSDRRFTLNQSLSSATAAAKKWINSRQTSNSPSSLKVSENFAHLSQNNTRSDLSLQAARNEGRADMLLADIQQYAPIGRGRPLPPPGTPLPLPPKLEKRNTWANLTRRNPFPVKEPEHPHFDDPTGHAHLPDSERGRLVRQITPRKSSSASSNSNIAQSDSKEAPSPLPKRRQRLSVTDKSSEHRPREEILIVEAPNQEGSAPSSPNAIDGHSEEDTSASSSTDRQNVMVQYAHCNGGTL